MWQMIGNLIVGDKWVKTNEAGRIIGRISLKEGEYKASRLAFDADGVGSKNYLGAFITLDQAKAAVDEINNT